MSLGHAGFVGLGHMPEHDMLMRLFHPRVARVVVDVDVIDIATQLYSSTHVWLDGNDSRALTVPFRYAWPAEMDLMAQMAGMALEHRWADWTRAPFDRFSRSHVSVWRKG